MGVLFLCAAFVVGVWLGWYAAHVHSRVDADLAAYLTTGGLPALSFDSAAQGVARPEPTTRAGHPTNPT